MPEIKIVVERENIESFETKDWLWSIVDEDNKVYDNGKQGNLQAALEEARGKIGKVFKKLKIRNE